MFILFPLMLGILINLNLDLYNHIGFRQDKPYLETILDILISIVAPYHNVEKTIMLCIIVVITIPFPTAWVIMKRRENAENDNYREWLNIVKSIFVILLVLVMHTIYITLVVSIIGMAILYAMTAIGDILYNITSINLNEIIISLTRNKLDNHNSILIMLTPSVFIAVVFALTAIIMSIILGLVPGFVICMLAGLFPNDTLVIVLVFILMLIGQALGVIIVAALPMAWIIRRRNGAYITVFGSIGEAIKGGLTAFIPIIVLLLIVAIPTGILELINVNIGNYIKEELIYNGDIVSNLLIFITGIIAVVCTVLSASIRLVAVGFALPIIYNAYGGPLNTTKKVFKLLKGNFFSTVVDMIKYTFSQLGLLITLCGLVFIPFIATIITGNILMIDEVIYGAITVIAFIITSIIVLLVGLGYYNSFIVSYYMNLRAEKMGNDLYNKLLDLERNQIDTVVMGADSSEISIRNQHNLHKTKTASKANNTSKASVLGAGINSDIKSNYSNPYLSSYQTTGQSNAYGGVQINNDHSGQYATNHLEQSGVAVGGFGITKNESELNTSYNNNPYGVSQEENHSNNLYGVSQEESYDNNLYETAAEASSTLEVKASDAHKGITILNRGEQEYEAPVVSFGIKSKQSTYQEPQVSYNDNTYQASEEKYKIDLTRPEGWKKNKKAEAETPKTENFEAEISKVEHVEQELEAKIAKMENPILAAAMKKLGNPNFAQIKSAESKQSTNFAEAVEPVQSVDFAQPEENNSYESSPYAGSPYTSNPYASNSYAGSPYASNSFSDSPYNLNQDDDNKDNKDNSFGNSPYNGNPYSNNSYGNSPYGGNPYASNSYGNSPYNAEHGPGHNPHNNEDNRRK